MFCFVCPFVSLQFVNMRLIAEQDRLVKILRESIALMCKSTLSYDVDLCVEGLLGITLDKKDVVLVNIKEEITVKQIPEPSPQSEVDEAKNVTYVASRQSRLMPYKKKPKRFKERPRKLQQTTTGFCYFFIKLKIEDKMGFFQLKIIMHVFSASFFSFI